MACGVPKAVLPAPAAEAGMHADPAGSLFMSLPALTRAAVATFADKGYRGARGAVGVPFYGRNLPTRMREVNSAHAEVRSIGERAIATLKT
jgi:hypothetical protein